MKKLLLTCLLVLSVPSIVYGQISIVYSFSNGSVADADQVNANFSVLGTQALNRTGGTMTGTLTSQQITPSVTNTYDLGTASVFFRSGYLRTSLVLGQTAGNYTISWSNPAAGRALTLPDPGGDDSFVFLAATQVLSNKTLSCTGCVTWTNLNKTGSSLADLATRSASDLATGTLALARGGTNADLSATGGTSQFLRQNSVGGTITVVRPAVADLSDASNVALLNAANTFTANQQTVTNPVGGIGFMLRADGTNESAVMDFRNSTGATLAARFTATATALTILADGTRYVAIGSGGSERMRMHASGGVSIGDATDPGATNLRVAGTSALVGAVTSASFIPNSATVPVNGLYLPAANALGLSTASTLRWGVNAAGDWTFGASAHITDAVGAPSIASGFCSSPTIAGRDYAFTVSVGTGCASNLGAVTFGTTWTNAPVCVVASSNSARLASADATTTALSLQVAGGNLTDNMRLHVVCRGY
jgi:hypothetical protein